MLGDYSRSFLDRPTASKISMTKFLEGLVLELCLRKLSPAYRKVVEVVAEDNSRQVDAEVVWKQGLHHVASLKSLFAKAMRRLI